MKHLRWLKWTLAAVLVAGALHAAEVTDLDVVDANNTGTAANAGFPEGMPPSDVNNASRALEGMVARLYEDRRGTVVAYGSGNVIRVTPTRTISAYEDGLTFNFEVGSSGNTGAVTFNIGTVGGKDLRKEHDVALASGDLESGMKVVVVYNADEDRFQMLTTTAAAQLSDPMTTRGDSIIRNSSNATARLAVGAANRVMTSNGTDPSWGSITTANLAAGLDGNLWTWSSSGVATQVTAGLNGQVLTSQGAGSEPRFENTANATDVRLAKVWVKFDRAGTVNASENVDSVTDTGTGDWTVVITTDFSSVNYAVLAKTRDNTPTGNADHTWVGAQGVTSFQVIHNNSAGSISDPPADDDMHAVAFGAQ